MTESSDTLAGLPATFRLPSPRLSRSTGNAMAANTRKAYHIDWEMNRHGMHGTARLDAESVCRLVQHASALADVDPARYSVHVLHPGMPTSVAAAEAPERAILREEYSWHMATESAAAFMGCEVRPW